MFLFFELCLELLVRCAVRLFKCNGRAKTMLENISC